MRKEKTKKLLYLFYNMWLTANKKRYLVYFSFLLIKIIKDTKKLLKYYIVYIAPQN